MITKIIGTLLIIDGIASALIASFGYKPTDNHLKFLILQIGRWLRTILGAILLTLPG